MTDKEVDQFIQSRGGLGFPDLVFRKDPDAFFTSPFGIDKSTQEVAAIRIHQGTDRARGRLGEVYAPFSGQFTIELSADFGTIFRLFVEDEFEVRVAHMKMQDIACRNAPKGWVNAGDFIGLAGSEGKSTGPHTHTEIVSRNRQSALCESILAAKGAQTGALDTDDLMKTAGKLWPTLRADMVRKGVTSLHLAKLQKIDVWTKQVQTFYDSKTLFCF